MKTLFLHLGVEQPNCIRLGGQSGSESLVWAVWPAKNFRPIRSRALMRPFLPGVCHRLSRSLPRFSISLNRAIDEPSAFPPRGA
jgi:hypothetical protein